MQTPAQLKPYISSLPAGAIADAVNASLRKHNRLVVTAPPGSGKSTLLPLTILSALPPSGRIVMLEPRRAAARQIACRMAHMLGEQPGQTVGYRMRFENRCSAATRVEVVTEGVMERMLVEDPTLSGVSAVIFDEFHERSLTADLTLALTLEAQNVIRPDLRIVLMSATMETDALCRSLDAPLVEGEGILFPVELRYGAEADISDCAGTVADAVRRAWREESGSILAFLPGQAEIARCAERLAASLPDAAILPLHGMLSGADQRRAIEYMPDGGRKIVLATPIAETSLTIEGIRTVVDSGLYRAVKYEPSTGLSRLVTERISLDMARQRAGRAGRLAEGVCVRLWSKAAQHRMADNRRPEIEVADLSAMLLASAVWGESHPERLPWITPPPAGPLAEARRLLTMRGALDDKGAVTAHGRDMSRLPCHPRIANMLATVAEPRLKALAADIAALLEEKDPLTDENDADINSRIDRLRSLRSRSAAAGPWKRIVRIAEQYRRMVGCSEDNTPTEPDDTGTLIALAYPERVAMRLNGNIYRLPGGENVRLSDDDCLTKYDFLAIASMGRRVFLASPLSRETMEAMATPHENISWNGREGRLTARREMRVGVLVVSSRAIEHPSPGQAAEAICRAAAKEGLSMFDFSDEVKRLILRLDTVALWHPELNIPDVSIDRLLATAADWLPMYLGRATTVQELKKIDVCEVIRGIVGYELMAEADRIAPTHLRLPRGRNVRIDYRVGSEHPVVSARLQDCLGLTDTPRLDGGRRPVLMELLSPGFKPVQLTQDLRGFWSGTYYEVRKELRRRYPKHLWPDDPLAPL